MNVYLYKLSYILSVQGQQNNNDQVLGVVGMDFTLTHMYYHLLQVYSQCDQPEYEYAFIPSLLI